MLSQKNNQQFLKVKILSNSSKNAIVGFENNRLKIKIQAPREKGKANKELIDFLAKFLKIPKTKITIKPGTTSSLKTICLNDLTKTCLEKLLHF